MRGVLRSAGLLLVLGFAWPILAADPPTKTPPREKLVPAGELTGKLTKIEGHFLTLQVTTLQPSLNPRSAPRQVMQTIELEMVEDVKVRLLNPPPAFDDKGQVKKYTAKELAELKGPDKRLPGFTGAVADLRPNQTVSVSLVRPAVPAKPPSKKDKDALPPEMPKPKVAMVVIVAEAVANPR
ncbi:MAG: hypothetical protein NZ700_08130 [Gemmataceae bacterium]|nr:hypothetical protein [Gemmataceae bacterium]MDW8264373.1 hypothetical protein [Gemmataceae bacterium]